MKRQVRKASQAGLDDENAEIFDINAAAPGDEYDFKTDYIDLEED